MEYLPSLATLAGVFAGLGVALASVTWAALTVAGLAFVLQHAAWLFTVLRLVDASYLLHLGTRTIIGVHPPPPPPDAGTPAPSASSDVWSGFLTSMTNPKAAAFFGSLFVVTLPAGAPAWVYGVTLATVAALSAAWHCGLALFFSLRSVQGAFRRSPKAVGTVTGGVLVLLGVRLLVAR